MFDCVYHVLKIGKNNNNKVIQRLNYDQLLLETLQHRMHVIHGFLGLTNRSTWEPEILLRIFVQCAVLLCPKPTHTQVLVTTVVVDMHAPCLTRDITEREKLRDTEYRRVLRPASLPVARTCVVRRLNAQFRLSMLPSLLPSRNSTSIIAFGFVPLLRAVFVLLLQASSAGNWRAEYLYDRRRRSITDFSLRNEIQILLVNNRQVQQCKYYNVFPFF
jgi:hypothetical protein